MIKAFSLIFNRQFRESYSIKEGQSPCIESGGDTPCSSSSDEEGRAVGSDAGDSDDDPDMKTHHMYVNGGTIPPVCTMSSKSSNIAKTVTVCTKITHNHRIIPTESEYELFIHNEPISYQQFTDDDRYLQLSLSPSSSNDSLLLSPSSVTSDVHMHTLPSSLGGMVHPPFMTTVRSLRVIVISDTHESHRALGILPPCDILIHAGDLFLRGRCCLSLEEGKRKLQDFNDWMKEQSATYKIVIAGNHDQPIEDLAALAYASSNGKDIGLKDIFTDCTYLCNSGIKTSFGLTIWGSPCSQGASGNRAFQSDAFGNKAELKAEQFMKEVGPIDILVTHSLCHELQAIVKPQLMHVSGHFHYYHGLWHLPTMDGEPGIEIASVAAPIMDGEYIPSNLPIAIDCEIRDTVMKVVEE